MRRTREERELPKRPKIPNSGWPITSVRSKYPDSATVLPRPHPESRSSSAVHGRLEVHAQAPSHRPQPFRKKLGTLSRLHSKAVGDNGTRSTAQIQPQSMTCERRALSLHTFHIAIANPTTLPRILLNDIGHLTMLRQNALPGISATP